MMGSTLPKCPWLLGRPSEICPFLFFYLRASHWQEPGLKHGIDSPSLDTCLSDHAQPQALGASSGRFCTSCFQLWLTKNLGVEG